MRLASLPSVPLIRCGRRPALCLRPLSLLVLGAAVLLMAGCQHAAPPPPKEATKVEATTPTPAEVVDYQDFTGRLDGLMTVEIRARVSGFITQAPFKEGDEVREGNLLFQIDTRPYQAALSQAEANLRLAETDRNLQERNAARARKLSGTLGISQEELETTIATYEKAKANVGALEAARDTAKLNLDYTHVTAPLSGRVSRRLVDPGNLVVQDTTPLTTIVSDRQLYAYFDVDERTFLDLLHWTSPGKRPWFTTLRFPAQLRLANEDRFAHAGTVNFIDNRVSATTGTVRVRAVLDNPSRALKAGLFVRVRLPTGEPYSTLLIPDEAIMSEQGRKYVYVVEGGQPAEGRAGAGGPGEEAEGRVARRDVEVGQEVEGLRAIKKGLGPEDRVIVSGTQRVRPEAAVKAVLKAPPAAPKSELAGLVHDFVKRKDGPGDGR